jgi:phosphoglycerate dehydrogenase-like enzyme
MEGPPVALLDPWPGTRAMVLDRAVEPVLAAFGEVHAHRGASGRDEARVDALLPRTVLVLGQTHLPAARLARAPLLEAVVNLAGKWQRFVHQAASRARGIEVLAIAPAMAPAVAEWVLAAILDRLRGLGATDRAMREGREAYGIAGNGEARTLCGATVGLVGCADLGRALRPLLAPFRCPVLVADPGLPAGFLAERGCRKVELERLLAEAEVIAIRAGPTAENADFLERARLEWSRLDVTVVLASRAEVLDFEALDELAEAGRFRLALDLFPEQPVPADANVRGADRVLLSTHRAGGGAASYAHLRPLLAEDLGQIHAGSPPLRLQRAESALACRTRSR